MPPDRLTSEQVERYQAHLTLPGLGRAGQSRLLRARVLVIGVGGLGCPVAEYLVAAGVGEIGLVDDDLVDGTNLQRQTLYSEADRGRPKVQAAAERLAAMNAGPQITTHPVRVTASNVRDLVRGHDVIVDGSDNFATRYVVNDGCVLENVALVTGSLYQYEGQVTVIRPPATPCYRCLFPSATQDQPACREVGVLGPLAGMVGTMLAAETIKLVAAGETTLMGRLLLVDSQAMTFSTVQLSADPACPLCGSSPSILQPTAVAADRAPAR